VELAGNYVVTMENGQIRPTPSLSTVFILGRGLGRFITYSSSLIHDSILGANIVTTSKTLATP
jgi:hypothetical protein